MAFLDLKCLAILQQGMTPPVIPVILIRIRNYLYIHRSQSSLLVHYMVKLYVALALSFISQTLFQSDYTTLIPTSNERVPILHTLISTWYCQVSVL